jgi:hypothetical protein
MNESSYWKDNSHSYSDELTRLLSIPKVRYCINNNHKNQSLDTILSQINPVHIFTLYFFRLNIILASTPVSPK